MCTLFEEYERDRDLTMGCTYLQTSRAAKTMIAAAALAYWVAGFG